MTVNMKKTILFAISFIAVVALSCQQEIEEPSPESAINTKGTVFRAVAEQGKTKTVLSGTDILWYPGDKLSLFCGSDDENHELSTSIIRPAATADFTTKLTGLEPDYIAVYPYSKDHMRDGDDLWVNVPRVQYAEQNSFDPAAFPCVARSSNQDLRFFNVCAGLKICFPIGGFASVRITSTCGETLSGHMKLTFDEFNHPCIESSDGFSDIILLPPGNEFEPGVEYYVSLFPGMLEDGLMIEVYAAFEQLFSINRYQGKRELKRNVIVNLDDFEVFPVEYLNQETVDLGLSVQWATCNLGAPEAGALGFLFSWGEVRPKVYPDWYNYEWCDYYERLYKYNTDPSYGDVDGQTRLEEVDDVASLYMGGDWRMPTPAEVQELIDGCNWSYDNDNYTLVGTSKVFPDRSIEIPLIGWDGEEIDSSLWATFWTSDIDGSNPSKAIRFATKREDSTPSPSSDSADRYRTFPVRPVYGKEPEQTVVEFVEHARVHWFYDVDGECNTVRCNVHVPDVWLPANQNNEDVTIFEQDLNAFWKDGKVRLRVNGSLVADGSDKYKVKYVFSKDQPKINGRKWVSNETGDVLYYQGEPVITLNSRGMKGLISYMWDEDSEYISKVLLNQWAAYDYSVDRMLYCNVDLVAYTEDSVNGVVELARETMHVRFLRPVNMCSYEVTVNYSGVPAGCAPIGDLFSASGWNQSVDPDGFLLFKKDADGYYRSCYYPDQDNQSTASVYWYNYYGFSRMSFNFDAAMTDKTGYRDFLFDVFPSARLWIAPAGDIADQTVYDPQAIDISDPSALSDAVLAFYSSEVITDNFNLYIPISVEYAWGVWRDYVVVSVVP